MTSISYINAVTDEICSRLETNREAMGNFSKILERDQEPSVIADSGVSLPIIVVLPFANRSDSIRLTMSDSGELYHTFTTTIKGYYAFDDLTDNIRTMRSYPFTCLDLFRGANARIESAHVRSASVNPGYFVMIDKPIYKWDVNLNMIMIEQEG